MKNADMPAFPVEETSDSESLSFGLTKREYFAAMAMQGLLAQGGYDRFAALASDVVNLTDALLEELEK